MSESMEFIEIAKVYVLFGIIIFILLWRFWRDINVGQKIDDQFMLVYKNQEKIEKEHLNLIEQIENLSRRSADLSTALHRLDQNTSRLSLHCNAKCHHTFSVQFTKFYISGRT